jgi:hypothetical protein
VSIATHISTFTEHDAEKSVTIDPMHTRLKNPPEHEVELNFVFNG